jgi:hypothetical protein
MTPNDPVVEGDVAERADSFVTAWKGEENGNAWRASQGPSSTSRRAPRKAARPFPVS